MAAWKFMRRDSMARRLRDIQPDVPVGAPAPGDPLAFLLHPVALETFLAEHHGRAPLLCTGADPNRFAALLTTEELDAFIDTADLRADMVALARSGRIVDPGSYVSPSGRVIPSALAEHYLGGATIILQHLHDSIGQLGALCRALEFSLSVHAQANIYLTPAGAQGFTPHADTHDVFILQIAGQKEWRLYHESDNEAQRPAEHINLKPGDCLYIPRALVHDAASGAHGPSLHITLGLIAKNWGDLLAAALAELAEGEPLLAEPLPLGHAQPDFDPRALDQGLARRAARLDVPRLVQAAHARLVDDYLRDRRPQVAGVLARSFSPGPAPLFRARPMTQWRLRGPGPSLVLVGHGGDLRFDAADRAALDRALCGAPFAPADLPSPDARRLVERLWSNGYIEAIGSP